MTMRRTLGPAPALGLLALVLLGGCGSRSAGPGTTTQPTTAGVTAARQVALVSATAAGGRVSTTPARLGTPAAVDRFTAQFRGDALAGKVGAVVRQTDVPAGRMLVGAVVAVACDVPPGVRVEDTGAGLRVVARPMRSPKRECFAPVTTVAVVSVPTDAL
jgi:hypothetical protein